MLVQVQRTVRRYSSLMPESEASSPAGRYSMHAWHTSSYRYRAYADIQEDRIRMLDRVTACLFDIAHSSTVVTVLSAVQHRHR